MLNNLSNVLKHSFGASLAEQRHFYSAVYQGNPDVLSFVQP
jgi:hypothetical protein